jgi:hypothetical protein
MRPSERNQPNTWEVTMQAPQVVEIRGEDAVVPLCRGRHDDCVYDACTLRRRECLTCSAGDVFVEWFHDGRGKQRRDARGTRLATPYLSPAIGSLFQPVRRR